MVSVRCRMPPHRTLTYGFGIFDSSEGLVLIAISLDKGFTYLVFSIQITASDDVHLEH